MKSAGKSLLMVFARNPVAGKVKTRLARTLGAAGALDVYRKLLRHTHAVSTAGAGRWETAIFYSELPEGDDWESSGSIRMVQQGEDLGKRMKHAFQWAFSAGYGPVIIIGSDCPGLTAGIIAGAFECLNRHDIVIGPATDGGYYLLGIKQMHEWLFGDIPWSSPAVLGETRKRIRRHGLSCALLATLSDVDTEEDLIRLELS